MLGETNGVEYGRLGEGTLSIGRLGKAMRWSFIRIENRECESTRYD